jgi:hypothetical protein
VWPTHAQSRPQTLIERRDAAENAFAKHWGLIVSNHQAWINHDAAVADFVVMKALAVCRTPQLDDLDLAARNPECPRHLRHVDDAVSYAAKLRITGIDTGTII